MTENPWINGTVWKSMWRRRCMWTGKLLANLSFHLREENWISKMLWCLGVPSRSCKQVKTISVPNGTYSHRNHQPGDRVLWRGPGSPGRAQQIALSQATRAIHFSRWKILWPFKTLVGKTINCFFRRWSNLSATRAAPSSQAKALVQNCPRAWGCWPIHHTASGH